MHTIKIEWKGPHKVDEVISQMNDGGTAPLYEGEDYGLYQIYGWHFLYKENTLFYAGQAARQTFSRRISQHKKWWLDRESKESDFKIYIGRICSSRRHTREDKWKGWEEDIDMAEKILIQKYTPIYNSRTISNEPEFPCGKVRLVHEGRKNRLDKVDNAPEDF